MDREGTRAQERLPLEGDGPTGGAAPLLDGSDPAFDAHTFTVAELAAAVRGALGVIFPDELWVEGQIASISTGRTRGSGAGNQARHVYFDLVDPEAEGVVLPVVLFDTHRRRVNELLKGQGGGSALKMTDGVRVRVRGRLDLYPATSRVQLRMTSIDPLYTVGVLERERDRLLAALLAEGLLERNGALPVPAVPHTIGLVTAQHSAAEADFLHELDLSGIAWRVLAVDAPMQGPDAPARIAAALESLDATGRCDLIALVRGGGARTDLAAFDHERIARTIAALATPVFTGIGHETDRSVADAVAAAAHKTPTACAAAIVTRASAWTRRADDAAAALPGRAAEALRSATARQDDRSQRTARSARRQLAAAHAGLDRATTDLTAGADRAQTLAARHLDNAAAMVRALDPVRTLERGYAIVRRDDGTLVRSPADAPAGAGLVITTAGGVLPATAGDPGDGDGPADRG